MKKALFISMILVAIFAFGCSTSSSNVSKNDSLKTDTLKVNVDSLATK